MSENQRELLNIYDCLKRVDHQLTELISFLEQELPLGQEFDLNEPDTYLELFPRSRYAFNSLSYSVNSSKSLLKNINLNRKYQTDIKAINSQLEPSDIISLNDLKIEPKKSIGNSPKNLLSITSEVIFIFLSVFLMSYLSVKIIEDFQADFRVIEHFCKVHHEKMN